MLSRLLGMPALNTSTELQNLISSSSRVSKVPDCQTPNLLNKVAVDRGSARTRIIGDSSTELADEFSPILASVKDKTSKTGQSSGPATVTSPKHTKNSFKCNVCTATYSYPSLLTVHMRKHSDERPHSCTFCHQVFKHDFHLRRHMRESHNDAYEFECPVCARKFETDTNLQKHMNTHKTDKPFPCSDCPRTYTSEKSLNRHKRKHHSDCLLNKAVVGHGSVKTRIIGNSSIELADELSSIPVSVKDKTSKTGQSSGPATVTSSKHKKNSFKCSVCTATYSYRSALTTHMKKHNDERPYSCILCPGAFKHNFHLRRHMREFHNDAYEFECPVCTRKFETDTHLQNHMDTHKTDKPFPCPDCPRTYASEKTLKKHKRKHHSDCQMTGSVCSMVFHREYALLRHSYRHNEEEKSRCDFGENDHQGTYPLQQRMKIIDNLKKTKTTNNHQPSTNGIGVNEPSIQKEHEEIFEKTLSLLRELQDPFPAIPSRESAAPSCDDILSRQEMPAETLPERQNADDDPVINQSHAMVGRLSAGGIGVNEPSIQEEYEEIFEKTLSLLHELQDPFPTMPSWKSNAP